MKKQVNKQWYNQTVKHLKNGIEEEKNLLIQQFERYKDAKNGKKHAFDVDNNIPTEKLFEYLENAVYAVGLSGKKLNEVISKYEPADLKIDWKGIEKEIKNFCSKNNSILCEDDNEYLEFVGNLFCEPKFAVPDNEKNNDRIYALMDKYFTSCYNDGYEPEGFEP